MVSYISIFIILYSECPLFTFPSTVGVSEATQTVSIAAIVVPVVVGLIVILLIVIGLCVFCILRHRKGRLTISSPTHLGM